MNLKNDENTLNYLGLDWGEKRIGLATGNSDIRLALPFMTVPDLRALIPILKEEEIDVIIVGEPIKMRGEAANSSAWLDFVKKLKEQSGLEVILVDERLSSLAADALGGKSRERASRDEISAAIILQSYLDKVKNDSD
ncbi:Holliday junction resolvase RuvX [Candidatus Falkowbacteria bacterium]|nr:Holliday junction resolvase RuvX [Candidatus Falkowbacteria bacterium]NCT54878.1 Holliday junction resolvase RuvX [Candidatus Falkowbacteria bacterium]